MKIILCLLSVLSLLTSAFAQGPLAPPGAPAPTMKSLDQVEARIPITNLPYNVTASGSYYVTGDLAGAAGTNGITVNASGVTVDLMGYSLVGVPGTADGINVVGTRKTVAIRNGIVRSWGGDGIDAGGGGINNVVISDVQSVTNGADGIRVNALSSVLGCVANENNGSGIVGTGVSILIKDCVASFNKQDGVSLPTSSSIIDCTARDNFDDGFVVAGGSTVSGCSSVANDGIGIQVLAAGPGSVVINNSVAGNGAEGISVAENAYVSGNNCDQNGQAGVSAGILATSTGNRIDSNHAVGNDIGIAILSNRNFVVRNTVGQSLSTTNFQLATGNSVGTITNVAGIGQFSVNNPWANFEF